MWLNVRCKMSYVRPIPAESSPKASRILVFFVGFAFSHYRQKLSAAKVTFTHERLLHLAFDSGMIRWIAEPGQTRKVFKLAFALESLLFGEHCQSHAIVQAKKVPYSNAGILFPREFETRTRGKDLALLDRWHLRVSYDVFWEPDDRVARLHVFQLL